MQLNHLQIRYENHEREMGLLGQWEDETLMMQKRWIQLSNQLSFFKTSADPTLITCMALCNIDAKIPFP